MNCDPLAYTGTGVPIGWLLTSAVAFLAVGGFHRADDPATGPGCRRRAVAPDQRSHPAGHRRTARAGRRSAVPSGEQFADHHPDLGHGWPGTGNRAGAISGIVRNNGTDSTYITAIDVQIVGVRTAPGSPPGVCNSSDYLLLDMLMPVARTLAPGGSTAFTGASIGLRNKASNQDTCKGATIELLYTAHPR